MSRQITVLMLSTLMLAACGTAPQRSGGYLAGDGPGAGADINLNAVPDAVPRNEPLHRYANRPYMALGKAYTPLIAAGSYRQRGIASWYGKKFHGQRTSSGEVYDMYAMTAAHPTLPIPSYARVTSLASRKSVIVRINDRGPFLHERVIDVSYAAAHRLGIIADGSGEVEVESIAVSGPLQSKPLEASTPAAITTVPFVKPLESSESSVYLQLGAFKSQQGAESFMERMRNELGDFNKQFRLSAKDGLIRVHIGPYGSQGEARESAEKMKSMLGFRPMVNLP
jgi:rare lipoprotein A